MIDETAAQLALRARARSASVCTTGLINTLSATAAGFARSNGSFVSDGFYSGMEVEATGYNAANNAAKVITKVTAGLLTIDGGCAVQPLSAGRSLVVSIPSRRAWENTDFTPVAGFPYITDEFAPAVSRLLSAPAAAGTVEETGLYTLTLYGLSGYGIPAIRKTMGELKRLFSPGTTITAGSHTIRVRTDVSTRAGQIIPGGNGWSRCQLVVPWIAYSINAIAA